MANFRAQLTHRVMQRHQALTPMGAALLTPMGAALLAPMGAATMHVLTLLTDQLLIQQERRIGGGDPQGTRQVPVALQGLRQFSSFVVTKPILPKLWYRTIGQSEELSPPGIGTHACEHKLLLRVIEQESCQDPLYKILRKPVHVDLSINRWRYLTGVRWMTLTTKSILMETVGFGPV